MRIPYIAISIILMLVVLTIILSALGLIDISPIFEIMERAIS